MLLFDRRRPRAGGQEQEDLQRWRTTRRWSVFGHGGVLQKSLVPLPSPSRRHTRRQQHIPTPENGHQIHEHVRQNEIPSQCGSSPPSRSERDGIRRETGHQISRDIGRSSASFCLWKIWPAGVQCSPDYSCVRCTSAQGRPLLRVGQSTLAGYLPRQAPCAGNDVAMAPWYMTRGTDRRVCGRGDWQ